MGREGQMGNSAFKKHIKNVFPMTSLKEDVASSQGGGGQGQTRPNTQVSGVMTEQMRGGGRASIDREHILQQRRTIQKLNDTSSTRCDIDNANSIFFPSPR